MKSIKAFLPYGAFLALLMLGAAVPTVYTALEATESITTPDLNVTDDLVVTDDLQVNGDIAGDGATVVSGIVLDASDDNAASNTLTIAQSAVLFTNSGASSTVLWLLPAAAEGLHYTFAVVGSATCEVDCNAADRIATTNADGDRLRNTGTVGDAITLACRSASGTINWVITSKVGTWSDAD